MGPRKHSLWGSPAQQGQAKDGCETKWLQGQHGLPTSCDHGMLRFTSLLLLRGVWTCDSGKMSSTVSSLQHSPGQGAEIVTGFQDSQVFGLYPEGGNRGVWTPDHMLNSCVIYNKELTRIWSFHYEPGCCVKPFPYAIPFNPHYHPTKQVLLVYPFQRRGT